MKKGVILFLIIIISFLGSWTLPGHGHAATNLETLRTQQSQKKAELEEAKRAADQKMKEAQALKDQIAILNASIAQIEATIAKTKNDI